MNSILFLTKYARTGASSRYRTYQYIPGLEEAGLHCTVSPLFNDSYLANKYKRGRGSIRDVLRALGRRIGAILKAHRYDLVVIEYELLPFFPAIFERLLTSMGCRYIVDYDDALFHQYDEHTNPLIRKLLGRKIATVMRLAEVVVAGNAYLAEYARKSGAPRVEIIPTVVNLDRYPVAPKAQPSAVPTIGWIGSPSTAKYLQGIAPALAKVCAARGAHLRLIGAGSPDLPGINAEILPWSEGTEVELMRTFDVGIMPLPDEPWARGKCGFKLIQYMACGLPVVASPVGVNCEIVEPGINGFLAGTTEEWEQALGTLLNEAGLRTRMGQAGRKKVEESYSLQVTGPRMVDLIRTAGVQALP